MKNTIYKYFFIEFLRYFSITLFALAIIVWTVQSVNYLDLVTDDGHAFTTYFTYSLLTLSKILTKIIPFCFLIATVLTIIKFEKDNELIVVWTSGLNKIYIVNLILRISLIIMFLQLFFTSIINPTLLNLSRSVLKNSELQFIPSLLKEKQFNDTVEGLTIFVEKKDENGIYENIFSFIFSILKEFNNNNSKYLIVAITPYTFAAYLLLALTRKKIFLYLKKTFLIRGEHLINMHCQIKAEDHFILEVTLMRKLIICQKNMILSP